MQECFSLASAQLVRPGLCAAVLRGEPHAGAVVRRDGMVPEAVARAAGPHGGQAPGQGRGEHAL